MRLDTAQTDADSRTAVAGPQGDQVKSSFAIHLAEAGALSLLRCLHLDSGIESAFHVVLVREADIGFDAPFEFCRHHWNDMAIEGGAVMEL